jgi:LPS-assembly protein
LNAGIQFNTGEGELTKANLGGAWRDGPGKVFNADYRYTKDSLDQINQIDLRPVAAGAQVVRRRAAQLFVQGQPPGRRPGRPRIQRRLLVVRGVMQQLATTEDTATSAFFLQLELRGLTKLGPNPLDV